MNSDEYEGGNPRYVDARELSTEHGWKLCPECGVSRWFRHRENDYERDYEYCHVCGNHRRHDLEHPCPECKTRMIFEDEYLWCHNEECALEWIEYDRSKLVDRLSSDTYAVRGKPGVMMGECPFCGADHGVGGGPDGELECDECRDFYAGQYSDAWFCYAIWMRDPERIRVRRDL